jgi:hypothetical protein
VTDRMRWIGSAQCAGPRVDQLDRGPDRSPLPLPAGTGMVLKGRSSTGQSSGTTTRFDELRSMYSFNQGREIVIAPRMYPVSCL